MKKKLIALMLASLMLLLCACSTEEISQQIGAVEGMIDTIRDAVAEEPEETAAHEAAVPTAVMVEQETQEETQQETEPQVPVYQPSPQELAYQELVEECKAFQRSGDVLAALRRIEEAISRDPENQRYLELLYGYQWYLTEEAMGYAENGHYRQAIALMDSAWKEFGYQDCYDAAAEYRKEFGIHNSLYIAAGKYNTVVIRPTGVEVYGDDTFDETDADGWTGAVTVSAGERHVVALKSNGTVMTAGENKYGQCDADEWYDMAAVYAGDLHTVGLKEDGTVVAVGFDDRDQCKVERIMDMAGDRQVVSVAAGMRHTLALLEDGTVAVCGEPWSKRATEGEDGTDIAAIYAGSDFSAGLKTDGTVVVCGSDVTGTKDLSRTWDLSQWTDMVMLAAGDYYLVGLRSDGTLLYTDGFETEQNAKDHKGMQYWEGIVHIAAGYNHTVAVMEDGSVISAGSNGSGQLVCSGKVLFPE